MAPCQLAIGRPLTVPRSIDFQGPGRRVSLSLPADAINLSTLLGAARGPAHFPVSLGID